MAFSVTPSATPLGRFTIRLTNLQLAGGAQGVIGISGDATADFQLPAGWPPAEVFPAGLTQADVISLTFWQVAAGASADHIHINKTTAPVTGTFRLSILNDTGNNVVMELYLQYIQSIAR